MYKFKFEPPQQHRRSLQQPKSEHIAIFNILDKCTQILRDDRLWIRNQIKNGNNEILDIFKQFPRSSQFSNLQIRLRKYVQTIKGKIKQQQLQKFKQTLNQHGNQPFALQNMFERTKQRNLDRKRRNQSSSKSNLKTNNSVEFNKTSTWKLGNSHGHQPNKMQMSSSLRHFQDLIKYKCNHDVIEERQSQNVTSARLNRQQAEQNKIQPLQEQNFASMHNRAAGNTYNSIFFGSKENHIYQFRTKAELKDMGKQKQKESKWAFQKKVKQTPCTYKQDQQTQKEIQQINVVFSKVNQQQWPNMQDRDQSIFDKHFNESQKASVKNQYSEMNSLQNINQFKNINIVSRNEQYETSLASQNFKNQQNAYNIFQLVESNFSSTNSNQNKMMPKNKSFLQSDRKSEENLFTPSDLLNQCRNFLKNRENSMKKSTFSNHLVQACKIQDLKQSQVSANKLQESFPCLFSRNNYKQPSSIQEKSEESKRQQQNSYSFPQIKDQNISHKKEQTNKLQDKDFHYQHFQTFASSNTKKNIQKALNPPQFGCALKAQLPLKQVVGMPKDFAIQDFLQELMEITQMNPFINCRDLQQYVNSSANKAFLKNALANFLKMNNDTQICLTSLAEGLNKAYLLQNGKNYPHQDKAVNSVYDLLDIEMKGYINREDIDSFLSQIEEAEVQNFDQVCQELNRLFDGADFANQQRLTYWHLYLVKNSEQFQRVSQLLGQFQFQIQRSV